MIPLGSALSSIPGVPQDRIQVIVQMSGGNDGLNTVVPYGLDEYYRLRPTIGLKKPGSGTDAAAQLSQAQGIGLNPAFSGLQELMDSGVASIVEVVGIRTPNRSHFSSMDIWHTGNPDGRRGNGWLGRYFDNACGGTPEPEIGISLGSNSPLAMQGDQVMPVNFESADLYRWMGEDLDKGLNTPYQNVGDQNSLNESSDRCLPQANIDGCPVVVAEGSQGSRAATTVDLSWRHPLEPAA